MRFEFYAVLNQKKEVIANYVHDSFRHNKPDFDNHIIEFYHGLDMIEMAEVTLSDNPEHLEQAKTCPQCCERDGVLVHKRIKK